MIVRNTANDYGFLSRCRLFDAYEMTLWDMLFVINSYHDKGEYDWCDIEKIILESLQDTSRTTISKVCWDDVKDIIASIDNVVIQDKANYQERERSLFFLALFPIYVYTLKKEGVIDLYYPCKNNARHLVETWEQFLIDQLNIFERRFGNYIMNLTSNNEMYRANVKRLYTDLTNNTNDNFIMSFNYTSYNSILDRVTCENVHGSTESLGSIIFGIDNTSFEFMSSKYIFTKTYRKVSLFTKYIKSINRVLYKEIDTIIFYGHSLNDQDYSYFQAMFDFFDLYSGEVKLEFRYSIYDRSKRDEIHRKVVSSVIALLSKYGTTLENKHHGRNLLHKLMNESRFKISSI